MKLRALTGSLALAAALAGCASYDGASLVAGRSTAAEVEALMGRPDDRLRLADGGSDWFYVRPVGRETFAVRVGADGVVRGVEQRRTLETLAKIQLGSADRGGVRALLGPPDTVTRFERQKRDVWEYRNRRGHEDLLIYVQFSDDGIVREVYEMKDYSSEPEVDIPSFTK